MSSLFQIDIPKRSVHCFKGQERLLPGMEYYSLILEDEARKTMRRDFCVTCWQEEMNSDALKGHSYWKSRIETKSEEVVVQHRPIRALNLLKNLVAQPEGHEAEIFILALYLAHARHLILRREFKKKEEDYQLYEIARQDEFITIRKISLSLLETATLQQGIADRLKN